MPADDPDPLSGAELATFVAAMDAASVRGAAEALSLTPSAVTKRIQALERRVNVTLFRRGRFGLRATEAGRLLYPEARQALLALERARAVVADHREAGARVLRLAASHTVGEFLVPGWLATFRQVRPDTLVQVDIVNSPGVIAAVAAGDVDVGFVEGLDDTGALDTTVVHRDTLVAVVARGHRWARRRALRARDLGGEPYVSREARSGTRAVADGALETRGVHLVAALEVASIQAVKRALAGGGFALMSSLAVEAEVSAGALVAVPVTDVDLERSLTAIRTDGDDGSAAAGAFWRWLRDTTAQDAGVGSGP